MKKNLIILLFLAMFVVSGCQKAPVRTLFPPDECQNAPDLGDGWVAVWCDEFNGTEVDTTKWTVEDTAWGGGNNEIQYYRPDNITVDGGILTITAKHETYGGKLYTSGRMHSKYKGEFQYGRMQVSAKMPSGRGTWAAIWMLPTFNTYGTWPRSGEIDIMEYVGYDKDKVHGTIHTQKYNHNKNTQLGNAIALPGVEERFVLYEMLWNPGSIELFADDELVARFAYAPIANQDVPFHEAWPFEQLFHFILNLAVGGDWGGVQGIDASAFPTSMEVEFVRVYQRDFGYVDKSKPEAIGQIRSATASNALKNMIFWNVPYDDVGVKRYEIYVDGKFHAISPVNSFVFQTLPAGEYRIGVVAVDFTEKTSSMTTTTLQIVS